MGSSKAPMCPWMQHSLVVHHLLPAGCQESDQKGVLPFRSLASRQSFLQPPCIALQVHWSFLMVRMNTDEHAARFSSCCALEIWPV